MIGIIGGSGLYESLEGIKDPQGNIIQTRYGDVKVIMGKLGEVDIAFISRHGSDVQYPPHAVNYKANIRAMADLNVEQIIATSAVGVLKLKCKLGILTIPDQLIDMTKSVYSYYNGADEGIVHTDMSDPFCMNLIQHIKGTFNYLGIDYQYGGTYICLSGPTFETKAEIKLFQTLGFSFVGMTIGPECKLARELGICYTPILLPVNYGAGMTDELITHETTLLMVNSMVGNLAKALNKILEKMPKQDDCTCKKAASG